MAAGGAGGAAFGEETSFKSPLTGRGIVRQYRADFGDGGKAGKSDINEVAIFGYRNSGVGGGGGVR